MVQEATLSIALSRPDSTWGSKPGLPHAKNTLCPESFPWLSTCEYVRFFSQLCEHPRENGRTSPGRQGSRIENAQAQSKTLLFNLILWEREPTPVGVQGLLLVLHSGITPGEYIGCWGSSLDWPLSRQGTHVLCYLCFCLFLGHTQLTTSGSKSRDHSGWWLGRPYSLLRISLVLVTYIWQVP